jgi:hypothetical protein
MINSTGSRSDPVELSCELVLMACGCPRTATLRLGCFVGCKSGVGSLFLVDQEHSSPSVDVACISCYLSFGRGISVPAPGMGVVRLLAGYNQIRYLS